MALTTQLKDAELKDAEPPVTARKVVIFTAFDGEEFEIPDDPQNLGRATALASEKTLSKIWDTAEEGLAEYKAGRPRNLAMR